MIDRIILIRPKEFDQFQSMRTRYLHPNALHSHESDRFPEGIRDNTIGKLSSIVPLEVIDQDSII